MDQETRLEPADIILTRGASLPSKLIRLITPFFGESRSQVTHAAVVVEGGDLDDVVIVEAGGPIRRRRLISHYGGTGSGVAVYRPTGLSDEQKRTVVDAAEHLSETQQSTLDRILQGIDRVLLGVWLFRRAGSRGRYSIAAWPVVEAFRQAGVEFDVAGDKACPDAIYDCVNRKKKHFWKIRDLWPIEEQADSLADTLEERVLASS